MRILITGSRGFIGKNLRVRLGELKAYEIAEFTRNDSEESLPELIKDVDAIIHLAGENRPKDPLDFARVNSGLTEAICNAIRLAGKPIPLVLTSSTQAEQDNPYGRSKRSAELAVERLAKDTGNPVKIYRLPGVFGKWSRPDYNSVVATFCHNIANDLPIQINDPATRIHLVYVDEVVLSFIADLNGMAPGLHWGTVEPEYSITLGELADQIRAFGNCRTTLVSERVGSGLVRALYASYVSYLPPEKFLYELPRYSDERGVFVEILKTPDTGQFSYFTAHPGVTRGGHYHHTKSEKFLVIKGAARFRFRNVVTDEAYEFFTSGSTPQVVETIPGWVHDITNISDEEMVVMLWANEIYNRDCPDTIASEV
jgi:UDP-2-acetamido-2,6-beta-L-arabino-hexul-4-ose reductase